MMHIEIALQVVQHAAHHIAIHKSPLVPVGPAHHLAHRGGQHCGIIQPLPRGIVGQIEMQPAKAALPRLITGTQLVRAIREEVDAPDQPAPVRANRQAGSGKINIG